METCSSGLSHGSNAVALFFFDSASVCFDQDVLIMHNYRCTNFHLARGYDRIDYPDEIHHDTIQQNLVKNHELTW